MFFSLGKKKYRTNQNKSQACENKPCDHNFKLRYNETLWQTTCLYVFSVNVTISSWKKKKKNPKGFAKVQTIRQYNPRPREKVLYHRHTHFRISNLQKSPWNTEDTHRINMRAKCERLHKDAQQSPDMENFTAFCFLHKTDVAWLLRT